MKPSCNKILFNPFFLLEVNYLSQFASGHPVEGYSLGKVSFDNFLIFSMMYDRDRSVKYVRFGRSQLPYGVPKFCNTGKAQD